MPQAMAHSERSNGDSEANASSSGGVKRWEGRDCFGLGKEVA